MEQQWRAPAGRQIIIIALASSTPLAPWQKSLNCSGLSLRPESPQQNIMNATNTKSDFNLANVATYGNAFIAHANAKRHKKHYASIREFEKNLPENLHIGQKSNQVRERKELL